MIAWRYNWFVILAQHISNNVHLHMTWSIDCATKSFIILQIDTKISGLLPLSWQILRCNRFGIHAARSEQEGSYTYDKGCRYEWCKKHMQFYDKHRQQRLTRNSIRAFYCRRTLSSDQTSHNSSATVLGANLEFASEKLRVNTRLCA